MAPKQAPTRRLFAVLFISLFVNAIMMFLLFGNDTPVSLRPDHLARNRFLRSPEDSETATSNNGHNRVLGEKGTAVKKIMTTMERFHAHIKIARASSLSLSRYPSVLSPLISQKEEQQEQQQDGTSSGREGEVNDDDDEAADDDDDDGETADDDDDESDVSHEEEEKEEVAKESILEGNGSQKWRGKTQNEKGNDKDENNYHFRKGEHAQAAKSTRSVFENREQTQKKDHGKCEEITVALPSHLFELQLVPVLLEATQSALGVASGLSITALVTLVRDGNPRDLVGTTDDAKFKTVVSSCRAVLYRGRGSCMIRIPSLVGEDQEKVEKRWLGRYRIVVQSDIDSTEHTSRRRDDSRSFLPPYISRSLVAFAVHAPICRHVSRPLKVRKRHILQLPSPSPRDATASETKTPRGHFGDEEKKVRFVSGGTMRGRVVWGPSEIIVLESSLKLQELSGDEENSTRTRLTILEGSSVFLAPGVVLEVGHGAVLQTFGEKFRPVVFSAMPARDAIHRSFSTKQATRSGEDSRYLRQLRYEIISPESAWGEVSVLGGGRAVLLHTILTGGGGGGGGSGDRSNAAQIGRWGHSNSRPVLRAMGTVRARTMARLPTTTHNSSSSNGGSRTSLFAPTLPTKMGAALTMLGGGVVDCPGKAIASSDAIVTLQGVLVSRVDTGGEHRRSAVHMRHCHTVEIPTSGPPHCGQVGGGLIGLTGESDPCSTYREDGGGGGGGGGGGDPEVVLSYHDPRAEDDNDGLYLKGVWSWESERRRGKVERHYRGSIVEDCTFANGGDDAIDVKSAVVSLRRLVIDGWLHEGIAASAPESPPAPEELIGGGGGGEQVESPSQSSWTWSGSKYAAAPFSTVRVTDSLVRRCGQGVEAGYGAPQVRAERVLVEACVAAAFRYGDGYDWKYRGHLSISHCATTPMEPLFFGSSSRGGMEVTGGPAVRNFVWTKKPTRKAGSDRQPRGGAGRLSSSLSTSQDQYRDAMLEAGGYYGDDVFLAASALDRLRRNHTVGVGEAQGSGRLYEGAVRVVCSDMVGLSTAEIGTEGSGADEAENAGRCDDAVFGRSERGVLAKELAAHLSNLLVGAMPVKPSVSNTKTIAGEGPLLSSMEPAFVREDCPIGSDFSAAMASMSAKWQTQWSGTGFMKDTFPLNASLSSRGASMSTTALVYCRVKPRFLDRFERQYSFLFGTAPNQAGRDDHSVVANPRGYYPNWHEVEYGDRKLVPLGALTAELFRPSLELLAASLRHPGIAQIKHMCGTALLTKNLGDDKLESLASVTAEYSRTAKNRDERKKGGDQSGDQDAYAFVFAQELAPGVPINRRVAPLPIKAALGAVTEQPSSPSLWFREQVARIAVAGKSAFDSIDLAIELADAVRAMHESPVGSVVHGDLKWSNIITPVATDGLIETSLQRRWGKFHGGDDLAPMLKLIDFDNAVLFSGGLQDVMPASPIAFCCDMGRGHNHLAPECQRCSQISPAMDVYVVGQRLLNFFDNQRINVFKQLGCVTSIYDTRSNEHNRNSTNAALLGGGSSKSNRDGGIPCDVHSNDELPLTSILRNGPYIEATWPGMVPAMASALSIDPHLRPTMAALTVELLAVRSRASTVTVLSGCRAKAWGMTTGAVPFLADPITAVTSTTKSQKAVVSPADVSAALMRSSAAVAAYAYAAANIEPLPTKESASQSDSYALDAAAAAVAALFPDYECSSRIPSTSSSSSSTSSSSMPLLRRMLDVGPSPCFTASLSSSSSSPTNWQLQFDASMSTDKAAKRSPSHSPLKGPMDTGSAASRAFAYWRRVLLPSNASPWDLGRTYMVVPNTVQLYSHSYLSHREERLHGCGLRFLLHHSSASTTTTMKGEGPQVHKETAQLSPWLSSSSSSSGNEGLGGRSLRSWRVMAKAVHSANGHFDDESLFREIKASALDAVLGTRLVPPCIGARLLLGGQGKGGLELATEAVARHPSSKSLRDSKRISCLSPQTFVKKQTGDSKESHKLEHQASPFNKTQAKDAVLVDASLCLYLDVVDDASSAALTSASHAAAIHAAEFESSHGGQSREKNDRSDNSLTVIELESSSSPPLPNSYPRKKKLAVPAAIDAAVAWSGSSSANSAKPSRKITAATSTPTFFRHQNELWDSPSSSDRNLSSSSSRLLFHPSHRNVVEYVIFSFLANCAKSAHNHFQLVAPLSPPTPQTASGTRKDKGEQRRRDESKSSWITSHLPSLVMIDNDRCFTEYRAVFNAAESSLHQTDTSRRYFPPGMTPRHVDEGGPPEEHLERFVRWRRLLWNTCEWIDGGLWVDEGKMKESKFSTKSTRAFVGIGGVRDLVEKLRWHARPENPSLSAAVREAIAEDTLHDRLQRTDTEAFGELDARAAELIQRVDECDKMRSLRTFHNLGLSKKPRSTKTKHWIKLSVGPPTAQLISTNSRIVNRLCSSSEPGGVVHCRASDSRDL